MELHTIGIDKDDFKTLETPGHINSYLVHINSESDIVGCEHDSDLMGSMHGIVHDDGKVTRFNQDPINSPRT